MRAIGARTAHAPARRAALARLGALPFIASALAHDGAASVGLYADPALAAYAFPPPHPFDGGREGAFLAAAADLVPRCAQRPSRLATTDELTRFHTAAYVDQVARSEADGRAAFDDGDTPVFTGVFAAASRVVGTALDATAAVMRGELRHSFQPIGGLHHAARDHAAGFCVFNDVGVAIATLRRVHGLERVAYVDIDAHHGDGVFYAFEDDPGVIVADVHQDGRMLFPGSGRADETGRGAATGTKLNVELPPRAGDSGFMAAWPRVEAHLERHPAQAYIVQCGADGLAGDPLAQLEYTAAVHAQVLRRVRILATRHAGGRLLAFGGGGYVHANVAAAWRAVLAELLA